MENSPVQFGVVSRDLYEIDLTKAYLEDLDGR